MSDLSIAIMKYLSWKKQRAGAVKWHFISLHCYLKTEEALINSQNRIIASEARQSHVI